MRGVRSVSTDSIQATDPIATTCRVLIQAKLAGWFEHGTIEINTGRDLRKVRPHIPDEIFFPTVIAASPFNNTLPPPRLEGLYSTHYIRMDEHYPWSNFQQRYAEVGEKLLCI